MKGFLKLFFFFVLMTGSQAQDLAGIRAKSYVLVDAKTGEILFQRNAQQPHPPASTVKLMTALMVWEKTGLEGTIQVSKQDTMVEPSHIPLRVGETVSIREMTHALLIGSDNDSAMVLARAASGSLNSFIEGMNTRARSLGCVRTTFTNPHGLPAKGQMTTAQDMLKIFQKVLSIRELRSICSMKFFRLSTQIGSQNIKNHNKLLGVYSGMGPAKTGWTVASRHTYAASAIRDGRELHLIILNSPNKWVDARALFDAGFAKSSSQAVASEIVLAKSSPVGSSSRAVLSKSNPASASVSKVEVSAQPMIETAAPLPSVPNIPARLSLGTSSAALNQGERKPSAVTTHTVRRGETLFSISKNYGVKVPQILRYNALSNPNQIQPGQVLFIPQASPTS
jgi:serine-type D-Ala-D-Ala carboxypeptidase (penicillin-binding protein 5/6)